MITYMKLLEERRNGNPQSNPKPTWQRTLYAMGTYYTSDKSERGIPFIKAYLSF